MTHVDVPDQNTCGSEPFCETTAELKPDVSLWCYLMLVWVEFSVSLVCVDALSSETFWIKIIVLFTTLSIWHRVSCNGNWTFHFHGSSSSQSDTCRAVTSHRTGSNSGHAEWKPPLLRHAFILKLVCVAVSVWTDCFSLNVWTVDHVSTLAFPLWRWHFPPGVFELPPLRFLCSVIGRRAAWPTLLTHLVEICSSLWIHLRQWNLSHYALTFHSSFQ